jgi:ABC-2 type transport system permease protein
MNYLRIWLAGARYSLVRTMMFRGDFLVWSLVELLWMSVNLLLIAVIYRHTASVAGWNEYEMVLLVGTGMVVQRLVTGFFWSNLFELSRNVRTGAFDFYLAQPGNPLFMVSTRKLDPDGLVNSVVAVGIVLYAVHRLGIHPTLFAAALYGAMILAGVVIHYSILVLTMASIFWLSSSNGIEGTYFTLVDFSRLPKEAFRGMAGVLFVWILPVVVVSNAPARTLLHGFQPMWTLWIMGVAALWFFIAVAVFNRGLRRYSSASS